MPPRISSCQCCLHWRRGRGQIMLPFREEEGRGGGESPTNNALLINFLVSSDAETLLISTDRAYKSAPKRAKTCTQCVHILTELPFCMPPLVVGKEGRERGWAKKHTHTRMPEEPSSSSPRMLCAEQWEGGRKAMIIIIQSGFGGGCGRGCGGGCCGGCGGGWRRRLLLLQMRFWVGSNLE